MDNTESARHPSAWQKTTKTMACKCSNHTVGLSANNPGNHVEGTTAPRSLAFSTPLLIPFRIFFTGCNRQLNDCPNNSKMNLTPSKQLYAYATDQTLASK
jgi:hypothetical protein